MSPMLNDSSLQLLCKDIYNTFFQSFFGAFLLYGQMPLLFIILISMAILVYQYSQQRILVHGNLLLLFATIVVVYFFAILGQFVWLLRYAIILIFYYKDPCDLLTPLWMVSFFYGPTNFQSIAYPSLHFCVMVERFRATFLAEKYEREGQRLGIWMVSIIWIISGVYLGFILITAFHVDTMAIQGMPYLTSPYSATLSIVVNIGALVLVILTALCDWRITLLNNRIRALSKNYANYSLARNYQLNENSLAMRLILPMDITYALLYSIFTILVILIRTYRTSMTTMEYSFAYNGANTLLYIYAAITMFVYIRFLKFLSKCQKRSVDVKPRIEEATVHFRQLKEQWDKMEI